MLFVVNMIRVEVCLPPLRFWLNTTSYNWFELLNASPIIFICYFHSTPFFVKIKEVFRTARVPGLVVAPHVLF